MREYWAALGRGQRAGLLAGVAGIILATAATAAWLWHDPWTVVATDLAADRVVVLTRELAREKVEHRIGDDGASIEVRRSGVGRARATAAIGGAGLPPDVGLEIFKETDFSTTDFAQRINYQRALQGEIARTLQTMAGVRQARVHVVLPEAGVLKKNTGKASAAVTLSLARDKSLSQSQVRGIQRLVASAVPGIKPEEVVVLDESGVSLSRASQEGEADLSGAQLDLKRQIDGYLEAKLRHMLGQVAPGADSTVSVDAIVDYKQVRVRLEEPVAAPGAKEADRLTGVVAKERQLQRVRSSPASAGSEPDGVESTDFETEYKVGQRIEQSEVPPGTVRRISVAVAVRGAPAELVPAAVEALVVHAIGIDRARGDSAMVMLLGPAATAVPSAAAQPGHDVPATPSSMEEPTRRVSVEAIYTAGAFLALVAIVMTAVLVYRSHAERARQTKLQSIAQQMREWLAEEPRHGN